MSAGFNHEMLANSHTALFESNTKGLLNRESILQNASEKALVIHWVMQGSPRPQSTYQPIPHGHIFATLEL